MNRTEHLLACLAEECDEVGQRVMKALRFGLDDVQKGQPHNNAERISEELRDLISVASLLARSGTLKGIYPTGEQIEAKRAKIERYMEISRSTGALSEPVPAPPVEGWRPIETAPKEPVLVAARWTSPDEGEKWSVGEAYISSHDNEWWWANTSYGDYHAENLPSQGFRVSHWMPLPTPPDSQGGEDA